MLCLSLDKLAARATIDVSVIVYAMQSHSLQKQPNLKLKTWLKQLLGSLPLGFVLPGLP